MADWVPIKCLTCKCEFQMAETDYLAFKRAGPALSFHCPYGHGMHYPHGETESDRLRREVERLKQREAYWEDRVQAEKRAASAIKGHLTRTKKRISAGTCPCCKRHFTNLERHMHTKHPEFADAEPDDTVVEFKSA